jgi:hypothetical protein
VGAEQIVPISTEATIGRLSRLWWLGHALFAGCQSLCLPSLHLCLSVCSSAFGLWISVLWIAENPSSGKIGSPYSEMERPFVVRIWVHSKGGSSGLHPQLYRD